MIKKGVYKERKVHREMDLHTSIKRQKKKQGELRERRVNSNNSYVIVSS